MSLLELNPETLWVPIATVLASALAAWATVWVGRRADKTNKETAAITAHAEKEETQLAGWIELVKALEVRVTNQNGTIAAQGAQLDRQDTAIRELRETAAETKDGLSAAVRFINQLIALWPSRTIPIPTVPAALVQHGVEHPPERKSK